ncbi:glycosyltransferase family 61 protein [Microcoleus sp. Pol11C2]|uniref:glycosyltransferase family 61 protein n=1 Tax=Microcoleus sp. Pol11C2 TaxID=3055389 RepID=UPI002FCEA22E
MLLALQDNLDQFLNYLQDEICKIKIDEIVNSQNHSILDDPWLYSSILARASKILFHKGNLKQAYICEKSAQPVGVPKDVYATTKEWALASNLESHYIEIHPPHNPNITTIAKTIAGEIHPNLTGEYWLEFECPETFISILSEGRYYQFGVYNTAVITSDNYLLLDVSQMPGCPKEVKPLMFLGKNLPPICKEIEGTVVVFTSNPCTNLYHYMFDFLPRFGLLEVSGLDLDKIDYFLLNFYPFDFYKETLEILGVPPKKVLTIQKYPHVKAKSLIVPSLPGVICFPTKWSVEFLRRKFMPLIDQITSESSGRVYISRNLGSNRRMVNEDEVLELLNNLGFITVYFEKMSMLEKVALMSRAEVVIGVCGAGLTNLVFANPGTKVIEIFAPNYIHFTYYILSHHLGLEYYYLVGDGLEINYLAEVIYKGGIYEDVIVNLNSLRDILELAGIK